MYREEVRQGSRAPLMLLAAFFFLATLAIFAFLNYGDGPSALTSALTNDYVQAEDVISRYDLGYLPSNGVHNPDHNVTPEFAEAWENAKVVSDTLNGGGGLDPDKHRCFALVIGNTLYRAIVWTYTHKSALGFEQGRLIWWDVISPNGGPEWGGSYAPKSLRTMTNVPQDVAEQYPNAQIIPIDSCHLPPPPGLAY